MSDIKIDEIRRQLAGIVVNKPPQKPDKKKSSDFGKTLSDALEEKNKADESSEDDKKVDKSVLQNTMSELERADMAYRQMMDMKGKLVSEYQKIKGEEKEG